MRPSWQWIKHRSPWTSLTFWWPRNLRYLPRTSCFFSVWCKKFLHFRRSACFCWFPCSLFESSSNLAASRINHAASNLLLILLAILMCISCESAVYVECVFAWLTSCPHDHCRMSSLPNVVSSSPNVVSSLPNVTSSLPNVMPSLPNLVRQFWQNGNFEWKFFSYHSSPRT